MLKFLLCILLGGIGVAYANTMQLPASTPDTIPRVAAATPAQRGAAFSATSSDTGVTLTHVKNLDVSYLQAGYTYICQGHIKGTSGGTGGVKIAINGFDGLTSVVSLSGSGIPFSATGYLYNGSGSPVIKAVTTLGGTIADAAQVYTDLVFDVNFTPAQNGTIGIQAAQHASNATATTVTNDSWMICTKV